MGQNVQKNQHDKQQDQKQNKKSETSSDIIGLMYSQRKSSGNQENLLGFGFGKKPSLQNEPSQSMGSAPKDQQPSNPFLKRQATVVQSSEQGVKNKGPLPQNPFQKQATSTGGP